MSGKIVFVNSVCCGSHGGIVADLRHAAQAAGYDPIVAYARWGADPDARCVRIGGQLDIAAHGLLSRALDGHGFGSSKATRDFVRALEEMKPALLHLHNLHGYYINIEILFDYIRRSGIPTLWTLHDCWAFTGHCSHFVRAGCDKWKTQCHACPLTREYPVSYGLDRSRSNYLRKKRAFTGLKNLRLAAPSRWLAEQASQSFLNDTPIDIVPNGVDLDVFSPPQRPAVKGRPLAIAVAAKFDARKGYADTLAAAQSLLGKADVTLVGLTAKQIAALPPGIQGVEKISDRMTLADIYRRADILINTTYEDTYPTVNMEAIASGVPVVSYAVGGCVEQVTDGCGRLVRVGDVEGMARAALDVLEENRAALRESCREYALGQFDRRRAASTYVGIYNDMVK